MPSFDSQDMLAPMSKVLFRHGNKEMVRGPRRPKEEADRLWKVRLVLHKEQTEARSLLEEALRECRDQRELATLATAVQSDVASISEQVGAMAEVVARGLDGPSDGLVEMGQQLAQLNG